MTTAIKKKRDLPEQAKKVKKELINRGMTQRELAEMIGMNENYLTNMLNGRRSGKKYWAEIEWILGINQQEIWWEEYNQ